MTANDHRSSILPDVSLKETRTLQITPHPYLTPDNAIVTAVYLDRTTGEPIYYPVEVKRKDLLAALDAEPDETDYQEVVEENNRLGRKLAEAVSEGHRIRGALGLGNLADTRLVLARIQELTEEAEKDDQEPEEGLYSPRDDQDQIDRSWALEKAGDVIRNLAAVGALPRDVAGFSLLLIAEWILSGREGDRG